MPLGCPAEIAFFRKSRGSAGIPTVQISTDSQSWNFDFCSSSIIWKFSEPRKTSPLTNQRWVIRAPFGNPRRTASICQGCCWGSQYTFSNPLVMPPLLSDAVVSTVATHFVVGNCQCESLPSWLPESWHMQWFFHKAKMDKLPHLLSDKSGDRGASLAATTSDCVSCHTATPKYRNISEIARLLSAYLLIRHEHKHGMSPFDLQTYPSTSW